MSKRILIMLAGLFYYTGLVALARWWTQRAGPRVAIVNYHTAAGGNLLQHLLYLRRRYRIMSLDAAMDELYSGRRDPQFKHDRRIPLVITFDDGYVDNFTYATRLAHDYCIPLSIYLVPGYIESGKRFWWFEGQSMARRARASSVTLDKRTFQLDQDGVRGTLAQFIDDHARFATSVAEREAFLTTAAQVLDLAPTPDVRDRDWDLLSINWEQAQEMDKSGWICFGAHSMSHPILAYLTDPTEMRYEIAECRRVLERQLGHPIRSFAYPVGQAQHISDAVVQAVKDAGYEWALTTNYGFNTPGSDPYRLARIEADVDQHWLVVAAEVAGLWGFIARLRWLPFIRHNFTNARRTKGK